MRVGYRYALAMTHHVEDAEDLVHDSWVKLSRRYGQVSSCAVLLTTIRHLFIDRYRRRQVVVFESIESRELPDLAATAAEEAGLKGDLDCLLAILRPIEREILFLCYYQGYTAQQIAEATGHPRGTVLSLISRSIKKLRRAAGTAFGAPLSIDGSPKGERHNQWVGEREIAA